VCNHRVESPLTDMAAEWEILAELHTRPDVSECSALQPKLASSTVVIHFVSQSANDRVGPPPAKAENLRPPGHEMQGFI